MAFPSYKTKYKTNQTSVQETSKMTRICTRFLVLYTSLPWLFTINLSIPLGPRVVRTASAMNWQAFMLLMSCGTPCEESVPSFSKIIPGCCQKIQSHPCEWKHSNSTTRSQVKRSQIDRYVFALLSFKIKSYYSTKLYKMEKDFYAYLTIMFSCQAMALQTLAQT